MEDQVDIKLLLSMLNAVDERSKVLLKVVKADTFPEEAVVLVKVDVDFGTLFKIGRVPMISDLPRICQVP